MTDYLQPIINHLQMVQVGADDWRLPKGAKCPECGKPEGENPGFSVSSKGWHDHHTGGGGSLEPLARKLGILPNSRNGGEDLHAHIYKQSTLGGPDRELILSYFAGRGINLKPEEEKTIWNHGLRVNRHRGQVQIIYPIRDPGGALVQIGKIPVDPKTFKTTGTKKLHGKPNGHRAFTLDPNPETPKQKKQAVILEGFEDALTLWISGQYPATEFIVTSSAANIPKVAGFLAGYAGVTILCDSDNPKDPAPFPSIRKAMELVRTTPDVKVLVPRLGVGVDANKALLSGRLTEWVSSLTPPTDGELAAIPGGKNQREASQIAKSVGRYPPAEGGENGDRGQHHPGGEKPRIKVEGGALPGMVDAAEKALMAQPDHEGLYQRGGQIVRVIRLEAAQDGVIRRAAGSPLITPVEHPALVEVFTMAAEWVKFDARSKKFNAVNCPASVGTTYGARAGTWNLRPLTGIISAPTLRRDGSILERPGYDERTGLLFLGEAFPPIPSKPSRDDALAALEILTQPISEFPFVEDCHKSVALSAILTALVRGSIATAPLHGFSAPTMGSGKSLLADVAAIIATGYPSPAMSQGNDENEDRKKLLASLTEGDSILLIDNVERPIEGGVLCSLLTQAEIRDRVLGLTKMVTASTAVTIMATGNNLAFRGDMTTRALLCRIDAGVEKPEERKFDGDLKETVRLERGELVQAALTVLRAYHVADRPKQDLKPYGRFEEWSDFIRAALVWIGCADPCKSREAIDRADDTSQHLDAMLTAWGNKFGGSADTVKVATHGTEDHPIPEDLKDAMMDIAEDRKGGVNQRKLGKWLAKMEGRIFKGRRFTKGVMLGSRQSWKVEIVKS